MNRLKELQEQLASAWSAGKPVDAGILQPLPGIEPSLQQTIYINSYRGGIQNALLNLLEKTTKLMGEDFIKGLINHFMSISPCGEEDFAAYAKHLAEFVRHFEPLSDYPYLADMILLECAYDDAYHGKDATVLDFESLQHVSEADYAKLIFTLQESGTLLVSESPLLQLWELVEETPEDDSSYELREVGVSLFIFRDGMEIRLDQLNPLQTDLLLALQEEKSLAEVFASLDAGEAVIMNQLVSCIQHKWIGSYRK